MCSFFWHAVLSQAQRRGPPPSRRRQAAFTLLELLVVMAIMALISTAMIGSFFGAQRAASYTAAAADVRNSLLLARQRACLDGVKTYFVLTNEYDYAIIHPMGRLTGVEEGFFYDAYTDLESMAGRQTTIFDLDSMRRGDVTIAYREANPDIGRFGPFYRFVFSAATLPDWAGNETYGILLHPVQRLPKGFYFRWGQEANDLASPSPRIIFNPDGSTEAFNGTTRTVPAVIQIIEKIAEGRPANRVKIQVSPSGKVEIL